MHEKEKEKGLPCDHKSVYNTTVRTLVRIWHVDFMPKERHALYEEKAIIIRSVERRGTLASENLPEDSSWHAQLLPPKKMYLSSVKLRRVRLLEDFSSRAALMISFFLS